MCLLCICLMHRVLLVLHRLLNIMCLSSYSASVLALIASVYYYAYDVAAAASPSELCYQSLSTLMFVLFIN